MNTESLACLLKREGLLTPAQWAAVDGCLDKTAKSIVGIALEQEMVSFQAISDMLGRRGIKTCDLDSLAVDAEPARALGFIYCEKYKALPVRREKNRLFTALADPVCPAVWADLADITGLFIEPLLARESDIRFRLNALFGAERIGSITAQFRQEENGRSGPAGLADAAQLERLQNAPAVRLIDSLIESAVLHRASDIHIEPSDTTLRARFRVDGRLFVFREVDGVMAPNIISRLKVMGGMDIAERRLPQDGRFTAPVQGREIDFRVSTLPTVYGEKAMVRLLYGRAVRLRKDDLGFFPDDLKRLEQLFRRPYGAVFMTGPTGSGKSTTLNCFLEEINTREVNVVTIEDPVENPVPGVNHMNVEPAAGLSFANALRHILRQDPDVIMVGEIRDAETARIAVQAAVTGHLVLSTLHTNDAAGVLERLVDMGIEPYLAAGALAGVVSQRLVRRLCPHCKQPKVLTAEEAALLELPPGTMGFAGAGCARCRHTGYHGRLALYEYIEMTEALRRQMIRDPALFPARLRKRRPYGLRDNAARNVREGRTFAEEVMRAVVAVSLENGRGGAENGGRFTAFSTIDPPGLKRDGVGGAGPAWD